MHYRSSVFILGGKEIKKVVMKKKSPISNISSSSLWEDAPTELTRRCVFKLIYGDTGSGRTTYAFTAPGPIAFLHSAEKIEGIIQQYAGKIGPHGNGKQGVFNFGSSVDVVNQSPEQVAAQATAVWRRFKLAIVDAYSWARTIIIDTDTDAWELIRLSYFGDVKPSGGRLELNWGPPNADWKNLWRMFKGQDRTNLILISKTEDEYKESKKGFGSKTGNTVRRGQKDIPNFADIIIRTEVDIRGQEFSSIIEKSWWNTQYLGMEVPGEMSNFPSVMGMITELGEEEWSR